MMTKRAKRTSKYFVCLVIQDDSDAMLLPRLQPPLRAVIASIGRTRLSSNSRHCLNEYFGQLSMKRMGGVRHATHKAQGAVNKAKDGPGKRLGAKKSGGLFYPSLLL